MLLPTAACRFVFDDDSLEVVIAGKEEQQTENAFVGGRNRWRYDTFVNWELWWPGFPILVYFKVRSSHQLCMCVGAMLMMHLLLFRLAPCRKHAVGYGKVRVQRCSFYSLVQRWLCGLTASIGSK